jgi:hypothetical protein
VKGISLFIVPKYLVNEDGAIGERNDIVLAGLNHKMGNRGTTNCLLNFGEGKFKPKAGKAGAIGYLVGEPHKGLANMFHMMNEARIGVGLGATVLGVTGYLHALDYARNRPQGRHPAEKDPAKPQVPIIEHTDVRRMLLAQKAYVEGALALIMYCARLVDEQRTGESPEAQARSRHAARLPDADRQVLAIAVVPEANSLAIQVHGGYGYTREYNVEQFYRDNRLNPDPRRHARHPRPRPAGPQGVDPGGRPVQGGERGGGGDDRESAGGRCSDLPTDAARWRRCGNAHRRGDGDAVRRRRHEQDPGQRQPVPGSGRPCGDRLDVAGTGLVAAATEDDELLSRQAAGLPLFLQLGIAEVRSSSTCWRPSTPPRSTCRTPGFN